MKSLTIRGLVVCYGEGYGRGGWAGGEVTRRGDRWVRVEDSDGQTYRLIDDPDSGVSIEGHALGTPPPSHILDTLDEAYRKAFQDDGSD